MTSSSSGQSRKTRAWTFRVAFEPLEHSGELVAVTGSCSQLGRWKVDDVVLLEPDPGRSNLWSKTLQITSCRDVKFRYLVVNLVNSATEPDEGAKVVVVRRWEASLEPRLIRCKDACDSSEAKDVFGKLPNIQWNKDGRQPAICGEPRTPEVSVQRGWVVHETVIQLQFMQDNCLVIWKNRHRNKDFYIKVTPIDTRSSLEGSFEADETSESSDVRDQNTWPMVEVSKLNDEDFELTMQPQFGVPFEEGIPIIFQAHVLDLNHVAFLVDIFARPRLLQQQPSNQGDEAPAEHVGTGHILPSHFKSSKGHLKKPIICKKFQPIGHFIFDFLLVHPIKEPDGVSLHPPGDLEVSYAKHWRSKWRGLDIGHRGLGNSYTMNSDCANVRENTIASIKDAVAHGADMVEFDVQLSKDLVPVIFHEYDLLASIVDKRDLQGRLVEMPMKNFTLEELHNLKTYHPFEKSLGQQKSFPGDDDIDHQPFPTLERALDVVEKHAGFNVEIKWDLELPNGQGECHNPFELNLFLDAIIRVVLTHAQGRKIVFSSFNPDVCTMVRLKQNLYPVLFLTSGVNTKYEKYLDRRTHTVRHAALFARAADILGISAMAEGIQKDPSLVDMVKKKGLVLFAWTDDQNGPGVVEYLRNLGLDGIIYDRIDMNRDKDRQSVFLVGDEDAWKRRSADDLDCSCPPSDGKPDHEGHGLAGVPAVAAAAAAADSAQDPPAGGAASENPEELLLQQPMEGTGDDNDRSAASKVQLEQRLNGKHHQQHQGQQLQPTLKHSNGASGGSSSPLSFSGLFT